MKGQAWRWPAMPIALLAIVALGTGQPSHDGRRELGGAVDGMVALINASSPTNDIYNAQFCGGVVVELRLVLTAAHCVATRSAASIDVVIGGDNLCRDRPIDGLRIRVSGSGSIRPTMLSRRGLTSPSWHWRSMRRRTLSGT